MNIELEEVFRLFFKEKKSPAEKRFVLGMVASIKWEKFIAELSDSQEYAKEVIEDIKRAKKQ